MTNRSLLTLSNILSFVRAPLAFLFLIQSAKLRFLAILLAMITDSIDGYFARRSGSTSRFGAILDPAMDKFFVYFALGVFYGEGRLNGFETMTMLSRDTFVLLYGLFSVAFRRWRALEFRAIRWGKVTTALQFVVLMGLTYHFAIPWIIWAAFIAMGILAFFELLRLSNPFSPATR